MENEPQRSDENKLGVACEADIEEKNMKKEGRENTNRK